MKSKGLSIRECCVFAILGTIMFLSKLVMEALPNIHLVGTLTVVYTLVYRKRALYPIYIFVLLAGVYAGFNGWWLPYLYIWTVLWGAVMLIPKSISPKIGALLYPAVSCLHGLLFGVLYAPVQAILYGFGWEQTVTWVTMGFYFDLLHGIGNLALGLLILPLATLISNLSRQINVI